LLAESQANSANVAEADDQFAVVAARLRPALERLRHLNREGKLEGLPIYNPQFIHYWAQGLAYFEVLQHPCAKRGIAALSQAISVGWDDSQYVAEGDDLKPLRKDPGFQSLIEQLRRAQQQPVQ
jgi:hypothetical protein